MIYLIWIISAEIEIELREIYETEYEQHESERKQKAQRCNATDKGKVLDRRTNTGKSSGNKGSRRKSLITR